MSQYPSTAVGQVSADGQFRWDGAQWVPIPRGAREPTSWTRPMQLAVAAWLIAEGVYSVVVSFLFINHDTMLRVMQAQGTQVPAGTDIDTIVNISIGFALAVVVGFALLNVLGAIGSYLGWRWIFWPVLVWLAIGAIGALTNLSALAKPESSPIPLWGAAISEIFSVASLGLFVWLLIGVIKFGPWAMKRPGT